MRMVGRWVRWLVTVEVSLLGETRRTGTLPSHTSPGLAQYGGENGVNTPVKRRRYRVGFTARQRYARNDQLRSGRSLRGVGRCASPEASASLPQLHSSYKYYMVGDNSGKWVGRLKIRSVIPRLLRLNSVFWRRLVQSSWDPLVMR